MNPKARENSLSLTSMQHGVHHAKRENTQSCLQWFISDNHLPPQSQFPQIELVMPVLRQLTYFLITFCLFMIQRCSIFRKNEYRFDIDTRFVKKSRRLHLLMKLMSCPHSMCLSLLTYSKHQTCMIMWNGDRNIASALLPATFTILLNYISLKIHYNDIFNYALTPVLREQNTVNQT